VLQSLTYHASVLVLTYPKFQRVPEDSSPSLPHSLSSVCSRTTSAWSKAPCYTFTAINPFLSGRTYRLHTETGELDRIRAFRRRQDSPSPSSSPESSPRITRERSPNWFHRMQRTRSSSKRSRSASTQPENSSDDGHPETVAHPGVARDLKSDEPMNMPAFLQQTQAGK
jgi:hypothetical protein